MSGTLKDIFEYDYSKLREIPEYKTWPPKDYVPDNSSVFVIPEEYRNELNKTHI